MISDPDEDDDIPVLVVSPQVAELIEGLKCENRALRVAVEVLARLLAERRGDE